MLCEYIIILYIYLMTCCNVN